MKQLKRKISCIAAALAVILAVAAPQTVLAAQGTQGDEMQVLEAEQLEIQLGADWAGVEFQLKTDAGLYPGTVMVGEDGVLRMEIGGSKSYVLTCLNSTVEVPDPAQVPATTEETGETETTEETESGEEDGAASEIQKEGATDTAEEKTEEAAEKENTVAGIPVVHIVLFAGGMVIAVGGLIAMHVVKKRRESDDGYDEDEEE